jgi:hypothetical protein
MMYVQWSAAARRRHIFLKTVMAASVVAA